MEAEKRWSRRFCGNHLGSHLMRYSSAIMVAAVLSIAILTYAFIARVVTETTDNYSSLIVDQTTRNLNQNFVNLTSLMNSVYNYDVITDTLMSTGNLSDYDQLVLGRRLSEVLRNLLHFRKDIRSVTIHSLRNGFFYEYSRASGYLFQTDPMEYRAIAPVNRLREEEYNDSLVALRAEGGNYSVYKAIKGTNMRTTAAIICIELEGAVFTNLVEGMDRIGGSALIVLDSVGETVYERNERLRGLYDIGAVHAVGAPADQWSGILALNAKRYLYKVRGLDAADWQVIYLMPLSEINRGRTLVVSFAVLGIAVFLLLGSLLSVRLAGRVTKPLYELVLHLKRIEKGDFSPVDFNYPLIAEVGDMAAGINSMCSRIEALIESEYKSQILAKDAQLNNLIAQINPHFLYNVMENISGIGYLHSIPELGVIGENLTDLLRYSIDESHLLVSLHTEVESIRKYVVIQNIRFNNRIRLEIDISEAVSRLKTLKFLLQPIVENSILHGFWSIKQCGTVRIGAQVYGEDLEISVEDDGCGMPPALVDRLNAMEEVPDGGGRHHVGVCNVHKRIKLFYGSAYGLRYESAEGVGTAVRIRIPRCREVQQCIES